MTRRMLATTPLLAWLLFAPAPARAELFYSIDTQNDVLVTIDSATGLVSPIGTPGYAFSTVSLAYLGGFLYTLNLPPCTPASPVLMKLDPATGAGLASVPITLGGPAISTSAMDGMTSDGTTLLISYRTGGLCGSSHNLADLGTNGVISNVTTYSSSTVDMDNIAAGPGGRIVAADGVSLSPNNRTDLFNVARPSTYSLVGSHFNPGNDGYTGLVFTPAGELWAYERVSHTLRRINAATGQVVQSVVVQTTLPLRGLAHAANSPVPARAASWGSIKSTYR